MTNLLPNSLVGRTILVLLLGLTLSHLASMAIHYSDRSHTIEVIGGGQMADRISTITRLMDRTAPSDRQGILESLTSPTLAISWTQQSLVPATHLDDWRADVMAELLWTKLDGLSHESLRISYESAQQLPDTAPSQSATQTTNSIQSHLVETITGDGSGGMLRASLRLSDATWVNFATPLTVPLRFWSLRFVLSMLIMGVTVIGLSVWGVRRLSLPVATLLGAAERLGTDVKASAVPLDGPIEVKRAARVFNTMQQRIQRFVEDRTQMVAAISHDLRTPITRLRLRAEFIADQEQRLKMLADLREMEQMISSTLEFVRDDTDGEPREIVDLISLIQRACDDFGDTGHKVDFQGLGRLRYSCRPAAIRRALSNTIDNAIKYGARVRVDVIRSAEQIVVRVDDEGPGLPESEFENVFSPFYRIEGSRSRETGGTGLGLSVARSIIRAHGGDVKLSNLPTRGLRVEVRLPR